MPITITGRDSGLTIALSGEIDHHAARDMMAQLDEAIAERLPSRLTLDLSGVTFMDSSGIALILRAQQRMQLLEGTLLVRGTPPQARRVLNAAGIGRLVNIQ